MIAGHDTTVGAAMLAERAHLLPLAEQGFELAEVAFPRVDGLGCVRVRTNLYSVPAPPGKTVEVRLYPSHVAIRDEGRLIARHDRCYRRAPQQAFFEAHEHAFHYFGGVFRLLRYDNLKSAVKRVLRGHRREETTRFIAFWPESYDRLLARLIERHGQPSGTRQMIQLLSLIRAHGHERVRAAVEEALALGCADAAAMRHLVEAAELTHARDTIIELDALSRFERPLPVLTEYDGLLGQEVTS
ncbi:MAG: Mu transposase domain-containing protein [Candidatus Binataceae bacterium]